MTWTNAVFAVGQTLTAAQLNQVHANFYAMMAADSGAPQFAQTAVDSAVVNRAALSTSTATASGTLSGSGVSFSLNAYAFFPQIYCAAQANVICHPTDADDPDQPRFRLGGSSGAYTVAHRYVAA